ncbi:nucleotide-binding alpha-beta plait domain-containing protein [Tanacetum coccineum]
MRSMTMKMRIGLNGANLGTCDHRVSPGGRIRCRGCSCEVGVERAKLGWAVDFVVECDVRNQRHQRTRHADTKFHNLEREIMATQDREANEEWTFVQIRRRGNETRAYASRSNTNNETYEFKSNGWSVFERAKNFSATTLFFTNFPDGWDAKELWMMFRKYGALVDVYIPNKKDK